MDYAVKAARGRFWNRWNRLRFESDELECLYQRYTLKLQRFSVMGVLALIVVLSGVMAALSLGYNQAPTLHVSSFAIQLERWNNDFFLLLECLQLYFMSSILNFASTGAISRHS